MRGTIVEILLIFTCPSQPSPASPQGLQSSSEQPASSVVGHNTTFYDVIFIAISSKHRNDHTTMCSIIIILIILMTIWVPSTRGCTWWASASVWPGCPRVSTDCNPSESHTRRGTPWTPGQGGAGQGSGELGGCDVDLDVHDADVEATWLSLSCSLQYCWQLVCSAQYL